jgi:RNase H-like domain found in reverse transcriptase/Reverse transcriptase (RNA-dependent DNA polymerase)/Integrase zinc binding domain/Integrase core domain
MPVEGKLGGRAAAAVSAQPGQPGRLGALLCSSLNRLFLVDTGAVYSVIPFSSAEPAQGPALSSASGQPIACWGWQDTAVKFGGRVFRWRFLKAAVAFPLLGADFLTHFALSVDLAKFCVRTRTGRKFGLVAPPASSNFALLGVRPAANGAASGTAVVHQATAAKSAYTAASPTSSSPSASAAGLPDSSRQAAAAAEPAHQAAPPTVVHQPPLLLPSSAVTGAANRYQQILQQYPAVLCQSKDLPPVKHSVQHHIETEGRPVAGKYRRLDPAKLAAAKQEFADMERQGIIRRSSSQWASPLHMVRKPDGSWRPCGDFRRLNLQTKPDRYTCPNIGDLTARLAGCTVFSKLDMRKGYYQVPVKEEDICKTAIVTPFGTFEFLRMPFGLRNAGQTFQRFMDSILSDLPYCFIYIDDVLVASASHEQHEEDLRQVLDRFQQHGLVLNVDKCTFGVEQLEYLGHQVSATGIRPLASRVEALRRFPQPATVGQLQTFLGMMNFYRRFIAGAAGVLRPLTDACRGGQSEPLVWTEAMAAAFNDSKKAICEAAELAHPRADATLFLAVDASNTHVGAALQQEVAGKSPRPLAFFSAKLSPAQAKYSAFDRELLACYLAIRHFRWQLEGASFYILTDHKPLTFALFRVSDPWTARQQRHLAYIAEYTSDIRHVAGKKNVVADALSRPAAAVAAPAEVSVDFAELAAQQATCTATAELAASESLSVKEVTVSNVQVLCDVSRSRIRPLVPVGMRKQVFLAVHGLAHPGTRATRRLLTSRYVWKGCAADVAQWCRECAGCARAKTQAHIKMPVEPIVVPPCKFQHVHVDLVGPLPVSAAGHTYIMTVIDRTTRWPEAIPMSSITAEKCADIFVENWVARYGVPHTVTTDRGTQFASAVWSCLARVLGFRHIFTTAYHPQANGMVERLHRQMKESLRARQCAAAWADHLPWVLLGLRAAPKEDSGISAAEVVFGTQLVLPNQVLEQLPPTTPPPPATSIPLRQRSYAEVVKGPADQLAAAQYVYVRRGPVAGPLTAAYDGPYQVLSRGDKVYRLQVGTRVEAVSADRLKPYVGADKPAVAQPPRRGRPPGTGGAEQSPPA